MNAIRYWITVLSLTLAAPLAHAELIVLYENDNVGASFTSTAADASHANVTASPLSLSPSFPASNWTNALTAAQNNAGINSLATAITAGHYFTVTLTPDALASASYTSLFVRVSIGANVQPAETQFNLLSSLTGFTSSDSIGAATASLPSGASTVLTRTFDLSGVLSLQDVTAGQAVEFRLYAHNTGANPMTRIGVGHLFAANGTDDLRIDGTISIVPEPTTLSMLGLGVLAHLLWLRRRRA